MILNRRSKYRWSYVTKTKIDELSKMIYNVLIGYLSPEFSSWTQCCHKRQSHRWRGWDQCVLTKRMSVNWPGGPHSCLSTPPRDHRQGIGGLRTTQQLRFPWVCLVFHTQLARTEGSDHTSTVLPPIVVSEDDLKVKWRRWVLCKCVCMSHGGGPVRVWWVVV